MLKLELCVPVLFGFENLFHFHVHRVIEVSHLEVVLVVPLYFAERLLDRFWQASSFRLLDLGLDPPLMPLLEREPLWVGRRLLDQILVLARVSAAPAVHLYDGLIERPAFVVLCELPSSRGVLLRRLGRKLFREVPYPLVPLPGKPCLRVFRKYGLLLLAQGLGELELSVLRFRSLEH